MTPLRVLAVSARTLSFLVTPPGSHYRLRQPVGWSLEDSTGTCVAEGQTHTASLFIDALTPDETYRLHTDLGDLEITTLRCQGLVDAEDFGASGELEDNSAALQAAINATRSGGTLRLGPGVFKSRPIFLKSHMTLLLQGTIAAIGNRQNWPKMPARDTQGRAIGTWEGLPEDCFAAPVTAVDAHDLIITGRGTIDGGGDLGDWWSWPKETRDGARRPRSLHLCYSDRVVLSGFTVRNSPSWTVHPYRCNDLTAASLRIENPPDSPNTDGLNPESCENVTIAGVDFSVGDDCIAIKAGKRSRDVRDHLAPTRNVTISHCRMERGHGAVVLGSEMSGGIHNVTINNCEFDQTDRGLRLKTRRGRGGAIENVRMSDVVMDKVPTPLAVNAFYFCDPDGKDDWVQNRAPAPVDDTTPSIRNIEMNGVTARLVSTAAAAILGLPEAPACNIHIKDFRVSYDPAAIAQSPLMTVGSEPVRHGGIMSEFAEISGSLSSLPSNEDTSACI